ncbi:MAG TPA: lycopene beta-cyclase CrtY [Stellaceae bacterium]|nr:lycopene beta-cyclase CrtY [Stellaceae bacterium]
MVLDSHLGKRTSLLLAGGGLANGLIAYRLAHLRPEISVLLVEGGDRLGGCHTWSFFDTDIAPDGGWTSAFVAKSWAGYEVRFPKQRRRISHAYRSITSERFHTVLTSALGDRIVLRATIETLGPDWVRLADARLLTADLVIDGRGPSVSPDLTLAYQKFLGQTVQLTADHGLEWPIIMDAMVDQKEGYRFVYVLPWDARTLLIEDTRYTDGANLDRDDLRRGIGDYARGQGWTIDAVLSEEEGVLPVALEGDVEAHWRRAEGRALSGSRAALFHPTTGYSFPDAVALADAVCRLPTIDAVSVERLIRERSIELWRSRAFFRLLNRMLFRAARPAERYRVLERFYGLPEALIARFYAGKLTGLDKVRILSGKPPVPIGMALRCIREKGHA